MFSASVRRVAVARRVGNKTSPCNHHQQTSQQTTQQSVRQASDMPVPQSQHAPLWHGHTVNQEGWEMSLYVWYAAGIVLQAAVLLAAPETSIESWARPEAKARLYLQSKGFMGFEFGTHYQDVVEAENLELWSQFAAKAVHPGEDDDDDDDDDVSEYWF